MIINLPDRNKIINKSEENNKYFSNNFLEIITIFIGQKSGFYIYFFSSFILSFFYYIVNTLIIYNYSPYLIILVEAFLPIDTDIIKIAIHQENDYIRKNRKQMLKRFYCQTAGYAILFFGALILNEIIVLNFCDLNKYTFGKINKRGEFESKTLIQINCNEDNYSEE